MGQQNAISTTRAGVRETGEARRSGPRQVGGVAR
jgi:hypothetical protein